MENDHAIVPESASNRRRHPRLAVQSERFTAAFRDARGKVGRFRVDARNVSRSGAGFVLDRRFTPGERCDLALPLRSGVLLAVPAIVRRCVPMALTLHEIGVEFVDLLDDETFVELDLAQA